MNANKAPIRFATFLSPILYETYAHIASYLGEKVGYPTTLRVGQSFEEFAERQIDVAFICGLPYVRMTNQDNCPVELLAAPVLIAKRYQHRPIYFSDVIVRSESPYTCFDDLHGCIWAYNERTSHSGCNLVCYSLLRQGKSPDFFGETIKSGSHLRSLEMVMQGEVAATAIDSHLLDVLRSTDAELATTLRVVTTIGPSSIPPIVLSKTMDNELKCKLRAALLTMHLDDGGAQGLREGLIERFVKVTDEDYRDLRRILAIVETVVFPFA